MDVFRGFSGFKPPKRIRPFDRPKSLKVDKIRSQSIETPTPQIHPKFLLATPLDRAPDGAEQLLVKNGVSNSGVARF